MRYSGRSGIYLIRCVVNNKVYIGQAKNIATRLSEHRKSLLAKRHKNKAMQNSYNKHGESAFVCKGLIYCSEHVLTSTEQFVLNLYKRRYTVFNNDAPVNTPMLGRVRVDRDKCINTLNKHRNDAIAAWRERVRTDEQTNIYELNYQRWEKLLCPR